MTAAALYEKTWQTYTSLPVVGKESLSKYCKAHKVHYRGLRDWLRERSIVKHKSNRRDKVLGSPLIAPVTILTSRSSEEMPSCASSCLMLKGVRIKMPGGVQVSIKEISGEAMSVLMEALNSHS